MGPGRLTLSESQYCLPTNEALPALESDPIRFGESFDVLPFTVYKRREVDAWKSELAHKFGEVKKRRLASGALFSRFAVVGHDVSPFRVRRTSRELVAASQICDSPGTCQVVKSRNYFNCSKFECLSQCATNKGELAEEIR
jgi:hypothetical protein